MAAVTFIGALLTALATVYALAALLCRPRTWQRGTASEPVPVSVLKPLCGAEPNLERNLASLCRQTHPCYQLIFGVRDPGDPAAVVVKRLIRRFPEVDIRLVADPRIHGSNLKVSNLINMRSAARHPWLVVADSDIGAGPDYLERVTAPLAEPGVGIVTCLYRGVAAGGFWSRVGALFIDSWFAPSVGVASRGGSSAFGFGATIALRTETLNRIGGFEVLKDRLADDFWLGELTRRQGLATILSDVVVRTDVTERSLAALWARERRWMQTIRSLNPPGYAFCFVSFTLPMLALGLWLAPTPWNWALALPGLCARMLLHWRAAPNLASLPIAALRDCLLLLEWLSAFAGSTTRWRGHRLRVDGRRAPENMKESPT
ncbi:bacteriohopanetetrol glucosamine biosynthesis glycosyltransferase HpnI [Massilia sp. Mn16-1_5]|uniref:bacteriohopanetetrol glucosamine biosynthesis glycosyltransferase HpnI n=1 Tax=Massilia sp. Mn16-1_5 TaxID=2079199 RepID=UPI00109E81C5|nr:bacteriohopanetetrol glucosamine biosynthesis glycosyltransferase HpnI [Massilia sp. Mn16-1_5]THC46334.1 Fe-S oxidoreductase [Massilia sp. Mn16-1_5]